MVIRSCQDDVNAVNIRSAVFPALCRNLSFLLQLCQFFTQFRRDHTDICPELKKCPDAPQSDSSAARDQYFFVCKINEHRKIWSFHLNILLI